MELLQLTIEHFKGIDRLELALDGHDADIYGDNATGKTTIFDAIQWLLFGKDSAGRSGFEVKPLGEDGKAQLNGQEVVVEAVIRHEGQEKNLRRVYAENWTRQRGSAQAVFTGHTTAYWVDGLPLGQRQYQELMDAMIPEKLFRLLTNPYYFSHILKWQERREILFGMCGETGDGEVLESNPMFAPLAAALGSHTVERYRKVLQAGIKRVNGELKALPTRIDEASRGMAEVEPREALQAKLDAVNAQVRTAEALIVSPDTAILEAEKAKAEAALSRLKTEAMMRAAQARNGWEAGRRERADEVQARMEALESGPDESGSLAAQIAAKKSEQEALRQEWNEANSVKPPFEKSCPTCGRPYDNQEAIQASLAAFNLDKARRLEAITAKGSRLGAEISELTVRLDAEMEKAREMQRQRAALRAELAAIRAEPTPDFRPDMPAEAAALESDISSIDAQIAEAKAGTAQGNAAIQSRIDAMKAEARAIMAQIAQSDHNGRAEARIAELMEEQKSLAQELEALENLQYLAEEFTRAKVEMIQEKINGQFTLARFKLFDEQINGGLTDACEVTVDGVPFADLNHAMQINVGLDIIRTLGKYYGVSAPVIVDNAESVTALEPMDCQMIRLIVSKDDKALRVAPR